MNADHPSGRRAGAGPVAPRHLPFAVFAVPLPAARGRSTEGQNGASRGGLSLAASASAVVQSHRGEWPTWGQAVASRRRLQGVGAFREIAQRPSQRKDGHRSRRTWICEIAQRPSRGVRYGRGAIRGRRGTGRGGLGFAKLRNDPPAGFGTGRGTTEGRTGTGRGGRGFCKIAQRPSRRVRHGRGHDPGEGSTQVVADVVFAKFRNDPPAGSGTGGGRSGEGGAQVAADVVFAKCATTLPPGSARRGSREIAQRPPGQAPEDRPSGQVREGMVQATMCGRVGRRRKALSPGSRVRRQGFSALGWMRGWAGIVPWAAAGTR